MCFESYPGSGPGFDSPRVHLFVFAASNLRVVVVALVAVGTMGIDGRCSISFLSISLTEIAITYDSQSWTKGNSRFCKPLQVAVPNLYCGGGTRGDTGCEFSFLVNPMQLRLSIRNGGQLV